MIAVIVVIPIAIASCRMGLIWARFTTMATNIVVIVIFVVVISLAGEVVSGG